MRGSGRRSGDSLLTRPPSILFRLLALLYRLARFLLYALWPLFLVLVGISVVVGVLGVLGILDLAFFGRVAPLYVRGITITLVATAVMLPLSLVVGFVVGWARISDNSLAHAASTFFVEALRGTPQLVVILVGFFVILPIFVGGINLTTFAFWAGTVALAMHSAAYQAEIFRNGFQSVPSGQIEAAHALGLGSWQTMRAVIFPQAFRISLPPLGNEFANVVKDSSLLAALGMLNFLGFRSFELFGWARQIAQFTILNATLSEAIFNWILIAIVYFVIIYVLTALLLAVERRMQVPGLEEAL